MSGLTTRDCTKVYTGVPEQSFAPIFETRRLRRVDSFYQRPYSLFPTKSRSEILAIIDEIAHDASKAPSITNTQEPQARRTPRMTRDQLINHKRRIVAQCIENQ